MHLLPFLDAPSLTMARRPLHVSVDSWSVTVLVTVLPSRLGSRRIDRAHPLRRLSLSSQFIDLHRHGQTDPVTIRSAGCSTATTFPHTTPPLSQYSSRTRRTGVTARRGQRSQPWAHRPRPRQHPCHPSARRPRHRRRHRGASGGLVDRLSTTRVRAAPSWHPRPWPTPAPPSVSCLSPRSISA